MARDLNSDFILQDCLFGGVKLDKNADRDKYSYSEYGIGFDSSSLFTYPDIDWGKNVVIFRKDNSSPVHVDKKKKDILVLDKGPTKELNGTTITVEAKYSINFFKSKQKILFKSAL